MDEKIKEALKIREQLFDMANKYALDGKGSVAVMLHEACNCILYAEKALKGGY
jgi:hypothetical protein